MTEYAKVKKLRRRKIKPPRPPLCLCNNVAAWAFGIVSPSKYHWYIPKTNRERDAMERYFVGLQAFAALEFMKRMVERRTTKKEWQNYYRQQRVTARLHREEYE